MVFLLFSKKKGKERQCGGSDIDTSFVLILFFPSAVPYCIVGGLWSISSLFLLMIYFCALGVFMMFLLLFLIHLAAFYAAV